MANWQQRVQLGDIFHDDDLAFDEKRDLIVARLERPALKRWAERIDEEEGNFTTFEDIVDQLRYTENVDEFDSYWSELYDWADDNLLWIETF